MTMNCGFFYQGLSPMNVRYLYAALFLVANVVAWFSRENHSSYFLNQRVGGCQGKIAHLGAGIFLLVQLVSFMRFITRLNYKFCQTNYEESDYKCFVFGLLGTVYSTFSTGSDYKCMQLWNIVESEDDVPYGYGFFHFVFAVGSMYVGMVFVGWDTHHTMKQWNVDIGWMSTWVHIVNEALVVVFYIAILLARIFGIGWLRHLLAKVFGTGDQLHSGESQTTTTSDEMYTTSSSLSPFYQTTEETMTTSDGMYTASSSLSSLYLTPEETPDNNAISISNYNTDEPPSPPPISLVSDEIDISEASPPPSPPPHTVDEMDNSEASPPPLSHTIELKMFEVPTTSGNNEEDEEDDDSIKEWQSD
ncbi:Serinc-domain containing serine and sphingolipid biosynthesis protein [Zea mays]|uniref:Serinc-domain containing serine and sphingolipid biosynthesis protein n=2 Tax=Zea mays TaxID=4577 RepID=A0A1D6QNJ5_MAIZE|nr:Serinc-domain containing serine and sphingolipid biosynthesis protein [Zea mays]